MRISNIENGWMFPCWLNSSPMMVSHFPGEWKGDGGESVGIQLLSRSCVWGSVPGHPAIPQTAPREQLSPLCAGESLSARHRWVSVWGVLSPFGFCLMEKCCLEMLFWTLNIRPLVGNYVPFHLVDKKNNSKPTAEQQWECVYCNVFTYL